MGGGRKNYFCDQVIFELIGKAWANGSPAYTSYFDHKGPAVFLFCALGYAIDGTWNGLLWLYAVWTALSMYIFYRIVVYMCGISNFKCMAMSVAFSIITILWVWSLDIPNGMTVTQIAMPWLLTCAFILCYWHKTNCFKSHWLFHVLYGIFCMMTMLGRASDIIFVFLAYVFLFCYEFKKPCRTLFINLLATIAGGFGVYLIFAVYFAVYDVFDKFMYAFLWGNFRYLSGNTETETGEWCVIIFAILGVFSGISAYKKNFRIVPVLTASVIHAVFYFMGTRYLTYLCGFFIDMSVLLLWTVEDMSFMSGRRKKLLYIAAGLYAFVFVFISLVDNDYVAWLCISKAEMSQPVDELSDYIIASGKSYAIYNDRYLLGTMMDSGYELPVGKYALFQNWHVATNVITREQLESDIRMSQPDIIVVYQYLLCDCSVFDGYDLIKTCDYSDDSFRTKDIVYYVYEKK